MEALTNLIGSPVQHVDYEYIIKAILLTITYWTLCQMLLIVLRSLVRRKGHE